MILPENFIARVEALGLIGKLCWNTAEMAMTEAKQFLDRDGNPLRLSINVSMISLHDLEFPDAFLNLANKYDFPADRIALEITETSLISELSRTLDVLTRLRMKNFHLSIDDFGSGYAMMRQLQHVPANELKIDKSIVEKMHQNESDRVMVEKIIEMGHELNMEVMAEGVMTQEQLEMLRQKGCDGAQGFLFSHALPADELMTWLEEYEDQIGSHGAKVLPMAATGKRLCPGSRPGNTIPWNRIALCDAELTHACEVSMNGFRWAPYAAALWLCLFFIQQGRLAAQSAAPVAPAMQAPTAPGPLTQPIGMPAATAVPVPGHTLEAADLEAFFDGIFPLQLERSDIAGASVLVMKDGNVLLEKGYGYADVKTKKAVDPGATIFRLASISKLFTWVSVMQLVEEGRLNLDTDVNHYLDFQIRAAFDKPITLRNLMTHTGGFEESGDDIIITDPKQAVSLRQYLIDNQPMRIFPPGEIPAYSNYGVGLASYIVQRASGEPFERYVQEHIFTPLGMTHSTFYQPVKKSLANLPSEGYRASTTKRGGGV